MPDPIIERIAENILDTLRSVQRVNGYHADLKVERLNARNGNRTDNNLAILTQTAVSRAGEDSQTRIWWEQSFSLIVHVRESEDSEVAIDTRINFLRADIEKALLVDAQRGGLAQDTRLDGAEQFNLENGELTGVIINFTVLYEHDYEDPYTQ